MSSAVRRRSASIRVRQGVSQATPKAAGLEGVRGEGVDSHPLATDWPVKDTQLVALRDRAPEHPTRSNP